MKIVIDEDFEGLNSIQADQRYTRLKKQAWPKYFYTGVGCI